jgi:hypothetical protein
MSFNYGRRAAGPGDVAQGFTNGQLAAIGVGSVFALGLLGWGLSAMNKHEGAFAATGGTFKLGSDGRTYLLVGQRWVAVDD